MRLDRILKTMGPVLAMAAAGVVSGCSNGDIRFGAGQGVPLAELDLTGPPPTELVLAGPDHVIIQTGDRLALRAEGDAADILRYSIENDALTIAREAGSNASGRATVHVTMPAPRKLTMAGSGVIESAELAANAEVTIAGSGRIETPAVAASDLEVSMAGAGTYRAAGSAGRLDLNLAGSGNVETDALQVERAEVSIAGSGKAAFASDGEVKANILGSGVVTVRGGARCEVSSMGSGKLVCERAANAG